MFGPRKTNEGDVHDVTQANEALTTRTSDASRSPSPIVQPRRAVDSMGRRPQGEVSERKLTVGKGLSLAGEITSCDVLVVEGKVEAKLTDGKLLEITEAGQFRGSVEIENADIAGRYDGQLVVHGRLTVRSTGRISGSIKYGEIEIQAGGQIIGEMQVVGGGAQAAGSNGFKNAAKVTSLQEEETEEVTKGEHRKTA